MFREADRKALQYWNLLDMVRGPGLDFDFVPAPAHLKPVLSSFPVVFCGLAFKMGVFSSEVIAIMAIVDCWILSSLPEAQTYTHTMPEFGRSENRRSCQTNLVTVRRLGLGFLGIV